MVDFDEGPDVFQVHVSYRILEVIPLEYPRVATLTFMLFIIFSIEYETEFGPCVHAFSSKRKAKETRFHGSTKVSDSWGGKTYLKGKKNRGWGQG